MKKLPNGISNYEELVEENYYYVDKTAYIEKLENLSDKRIMFLRPRKFGKTLFTSVLENYYDDVDIMRSLVDISMEKALDYALSYTIKDLVQQGRQIHPDTMEAYNFVKENI